MHQMLSTSLRHTRYRAIGCALSVFLLLAAQLATVQHSIEHTHHNAGELCAGFQAFEHSSASLGSVPSLAGIEPADELVTVAQTAASAGKSFAQPIRGPPALSLI